MVQPQAQPKPVYQSLLSVQDFVRHQIWCQIETINLMQSPDSTVLLKTLQPLLHGCPNLKHLCLLGVFQDTGEQGDGLSMPSDLFSQS